MPRRQVLVGLICTLMMAGSAQAVTLYTVEGDFQTALTGGFTLVNLDAPPLDAFPSGYGVSDPLPAAAFLGFGLDFQLINATVVGGQDGQISKPLRDRLIFNGDGFYGNGVNSGNMAFDFTASVNGFGALINDNDVGRIRAFSGAGLSGTLLGEIDIPVSGFAGLISTIPIGSVEILCEAGDHKCGMYDLQFGTLADAPPVPEPGTVVLLGAGLLGLVALRRRVA